MTLDQMNDLSKAGLFWDTRKNEVIILAGNDQDGMNTVFKGIIQEAYPDFNRSSETCFFFRASPGDIIKLKPTAPLSYSGPTVDAAIVLQTMAKNAGLSLENSGVTVKLGSSYFSGTSWDQIVKMVRAANINATLDPVSGVLAIWPKAGSREGSVVVIAPTTGMIKYPQFSAPQVMVRVLFGSKVVQLTKGPGQKVKIESQLTAANGIFVASEITLNLSSQRPGGPWEMIVTAYPPNLGQSGGP